MIHWKTVFVLGAGASMPYEFDSGKKMLTETKKMNEARIVDAILGTANIQQIGQFKRAVDASLNESLDAFLEHRKDPVEKLIGKRLIARRLLQQEFDSVRNFDSKDDWIPYLYSLMVAGVHSIEEFAENPVTFVTYNYDRLIEYKIAEGLRAQFGNSIEECAAVFDKIKIIHLHGWLGKPYASANNQSEVIPFALGATDQKTLDMSWSPKLINSSNLIQIVDEATPDTDEFKAARLALSTADRVFFLGFGFGLTNVDRLDFTYVNKDAQMYATRVGMTDQEFELYARQPIAKSQKGNLDNNTQPSWGCRQFLSEHVISLVKRSNRRSAK